MAGILRLLIRAAIAGIVLGLLVVSTVLIWNALKTSDKFIVKTIEVRGAAHTDLKRLEKIYKPFIQQNIFSDITPDKLMTEDPWVVRLEIKRVLPSKLVIIVVEEKELLSYVSGDRCFTRTVSGIDIQSPCNGVHIRLTDASSAELTEFAEMYNSNSIFKDYSIELKKGFFSMSKDNMTLTGSYLPGVFIGNYEEFVTKIAQRYKIVESVDMTVYGRIYVKGVTNGKS